MIIEEERKRSGPSFQQNYEGYGEENREGIARVSLLFSFNLTDGSRWINFNLGKFYGEVAKMTSSVK